MPPRKNKMDNGQKKRVSTTFVEEEIQEAEYQDDCYICCQMSGSVIDTIGHHCPAHFFKVEEENDGHCSNDKETWICGVCKEVSQMGKGCVCYDSNDIICYSCKKPGILLNCTECKISGHYECIRKHTEQNPRLPWICIFCTKDNDEKCFRCRQTGSLVLCTNCDNSAHLMCIENCEKPDDWICELCTTNK